MQPGNVLAQRGKPFGAQPSGCGIDQQRGADLDDDAAEIGKRWGAGGHECSASLIGVAGSSPATTDVIKAARPAPSRMAARRLPYAPCRSHAGAPARFPGHLVWTGRKAPAAFSSRLSSAP